MTMAAVSTTKITSLLLMIMLLISFIFFGLIILMHNPNIHDQSCVLVSCVRVTKNPTNSLLHAASRKVLKTYSMHETSVDLNKNDQEMSWVGSELRNVPSGPDPLHHNGGTTKKPKTTP